MQRFVLIFSLEQQTLMTDTLLLIDDNAVQAATRQTILKRAGYFVIAALNPERALAQFQSDEFPVEVQLVITDHIRNECAVPPEATAAG